MRFRTHERTWRVRTRPVRISVPYGYVEARSHMFKVKVQMARSDPRLYGDELRTARVPIYDPQAAIGSAGYELPEDLPFDVDSIVGVGGEILAANQGNDIAYPVLSVRNQGDTTLEKVTFVNLSAELTFIVETPLATGQTLVADMDALVRAAPGPHIHVDGTTRYSDWALPRIPWGLVGGTNRVRLLVEASDPFNSEDITARMTWRDTSA